MDIILSNYLICLGLKSTINLQAAGFLDYNKRNDVRTYPSFFNPLVLMLV